MNAKLFLSVSAAFALGLAACGGSDDDDDVTDSGIITYDSGIPTTTDASEPAGDAYVVIDDASVPEDASEPEDASTGEDASVIDDASVTDDASLPPAGSGHILISQIYIGGTGGDNGLPSAISKTYIEFHNAGGGPVDMKDYAFIYGGKTGVPSFIQELSGFCQNANCVVPAGGYLTMAIQNTSNADSAVALVPDIDLEAGNTSIGEKGIYAIVKDNTLTTASTCSDVVAAAEDVVAAASNECESVTKAPALSNRGSDAITRKDAGCKDTGDNAVDFESKAAAPRTLSSPASVCPAL